MFITSTRNCSILCARCRGSLDNSKDIELAFVKAGVHAFIEKPLSVVPPEQFNLYADELHKEGERKNVITSVGYMFR